MQKIPSYPKKYITVFFAAMVFTTLPACKKWVGVDAPPKDAVAIFDEAWNLMDSRYSLFTFKGVDWDSSYRLYRPKVNTGMTDQALFLVLTDLLASLKDGHISLTTNTDTSTYEGFYTAYSPDFNYSILLGNYLRPDYQTLGPVIYKIQNDIGYIYYASFLEDVSDADMEKILTYLKDTKGLIIDVRNNFGGNSLNVDRLVGHFIASRQPVKFNMTKNGPGHDDFNAPDPYYISPRGTFYAHPVRVLTNRSCFSACNDFALYMSLQKNVVLIGDQTGGGSGTPFNYLLANGWKLQYSATMTLSPDGTNVENGIKPALPQDISSQDEYNGKDPILEKAFQSLQ